MSGPTTPAGAATPGVDLRSWFLLLETPGLGRSAQRRLLAAFGDPNAVLHAPYSALKTVVAPAQAHALTQTAASPGHTLLQRWAHCEAWLAGAPGRRHVVVLGDAAYPPLLLQSADPPLMLYVEGDPACLSLPALAVVGSRHATPQGLDNARTLAHEVARQGLVIVSGLARGIDAAAHEGALAAHAQGGASTIAVLGGGLDEIYPPAHQGLARHIAEVGALVSEYSPGAPPLARNFPQRNRIIAGLGLGTLVVEAALRSGSLITARLAAEAGREVFAVPGSIHADQAKGCHALLKQGAKLVEVAADILEELQIASSPASPVEPVGLPSSAGGADEEPLLAAMGHHPTSLDALQARTGMPTPELMARLLELEFENRVARLPGGLYQRRGLG